MIFSRKTLEAVLTNEAYSRWLLACRPQPIAWFLGLSQLEQETLAALGQEHTEDICIGIGYAVQDPAAAEAGLDADTNPESEEVLVRRLAAEFVAKAQNGTQEAAKPATPLSMGGVSQRREESDQARQASKDRSRVLFGRLPDEATVS